jgi:hypothetical protein
VNRLFFFALALIAGICLSFLSPATLVRANPPVLAKRATWEFRAVSFGTDEKENTRKLNELAAAGWEYVGPLANSMVAFKRYVPPPQPAVPPPASPKVAQAEYKDVVIVNIWSPPPLTLPGAGPGPPPPQRDDPARQVYLSVKVKDKVIDLLIDAETVVRHESLRDTGMIGIPQSLGQIRADLKTKKADDGPETIREILVKKP